RPLLRAQQRSLPPIRSNGQAILKPCAFPFETPILCYENKMRTFSQSESLRTRATRRNLQERIINGCLVYRERCDRRPGPSREPKALHGCVGTAAQTAWR